MQIEIEVPRPLLLLTLLLGGGALLFWQPWQSTIASVPLRASLIADSNTSAQSAPAEAANSTNMSQAQVTPAATPAIPPMPYGYPYPMPMWAPPMYYGMPTAQYGMPTGMPSAFNVAYGQSVSSTTVESEEERLQKEEAMKKQLAEKSIRDSREAILRESLASLEAESKKGPMTPEQQTNFNQATRQLTALLQDKQLAEATLLRYYQQEVDADADALRQSAAINATSDSVINLQYPITPIHGISAYFHDEAYKARFGRDHGAVDLPIEVDTPVLAAAEGIVTKVVDNGYGFNYITITHPNGLITLYGHLHHEEAQVGQRVAAGQEIGKSGGLPGDKGSGQSTGPHVHFAVYKNGEAVDPLDYLPPVSAFVK